MKQIDTKTVRLKAMDYLARREHSRRELALKLARKFPDSDELDRVLDTLAADGLQSDRRFTGSFIRLRVQGGYGPQRIRAELRQRGISDALIVEQFSEQDVDWFAVAEAVFLKKYADVNLDEPRERAKCMRYLQYKGYDLEHINALL
ncbi:regulatory protein RecX [Zhongshania sp.]|uniref:regulatory protein RecX n=1 Tax=Zhongshania sp. TaxID=1971902 RepID=UPI002A831EC4|nr:regulatory protein RecX [Zhongshania sp.]